MLPLQNTLKPMRIASKSEKPKPAPEKKKKKKKSDFLPFEPPALRMHAYTRPRSFARTHARTTRTRNETETDFPIGLS